MTEQPTDPPAAEEESVGPVEHFVLEFPSGRVSTDAFRVLDAVLQQGFLRLLDVKFVTKAPDGHVSAVDPTPEQAGDLTGGLLLAFRAPFLDPARVQTAGGLLAPGSLGAVLLLEQTWVAEVQRVLSRDGARLVSHALVSDEELAAVLGGDPTGADG